MDHVNAEQWSSRDVARLLALVEAERRFYQDIVSDIPVGLLQIDEAGRVVSANRAFRRRFNLRLEDLPQRRLDDLVSCSCLASRTDEVLKSRIPQYDVPVDAAGSRFRVAILPARGWDGAEQEALLVFEELAAASRAPSLDDFEGVFWQRDAETLSFTYASQQAATLFGFPAERWVADPGFWQERVHADDRAGLLHFYKEVARQSSPRSVEYRALTAAGATLWLRDTIRPLPGGDGRIDRLSVITVDVTGHRRAERRRAQADRVEALAQLCGRLAHDFNNQLMIVTGYGEDLEERLAAQNVLSGDVGEIIRAARRMAAITQELHAYSHLSSCDPRPLDLAEALEDLERKLRKDSPGLEVHVHQPLPHVLADRVVLEQALSTLAVHAAASGGPVSVSCARASEAFVEISVTGGLVAGEEMHRRLEPFEDPFAGANPPLAAVARMIRRCGAELETGGDVGEPAFWRILLPSARVAAPAQPPAATILVAEDEGAIRALICKTLLRHNYKVLEAASEEEALRLAGDTAGQIDLLIADVALAGADGFILAEGLRRLRPAMKAVFISGYAGATGIDPAVVLQKPFSLAALLAKVRAVLGQVSSAAAGR